MFILWWEKQVCRNKYFPQEIWRVYCGLRARRGSLTNRSWHHLIGAEPEPLIFAHLSHFDQHLKDGTIDARHAAEHLGHPALNKVGHRLLLVKFCSNCQFWCYYMFMLRLGGHLGEEVQEIPHSVTRDTRHCENWRFLEETPEFVRIKYQTITTRTTSCIKAEVRKIGKKSCSTSVFILCKKDTFSTSRDVRELQIRA